MEATFSEYYRYIASYCRSVFNCEYLLIVNYEYFLCLQLIDLTCAYAIIQYGVDHRNWIRNLA